MTNYNLPNETPVSIREGWGAGEKVRTGRVVGRKSAWYRVRFDDNGEERDITHGHVAFERARRELDKAGPAPQVQP